MSEAARAKGDLESWVGWLQAAVAAAGDADTAARLRRLAAEAVVTHDEAALRYGRLTWRWHGGGGARPGEADQLPTLMRIEPFNATLAATRRATVRRWRRRHAEFLARYSTLLQYSAVLYSIVPRQVPDVPQPAAARGGGHLGQGRLQGEDGRAVPAGGYHLNKDCVYLTLTSTVTRFPGLATSWPAAPSPAATSAEARSRTSAWAPPSWSTSASSPGSSSSTTSSARRSATSCGPGAGAG